MRLLRWLRPDPDLSRTGRRASAGFQRANDRIEDAHGDNGKRFVLRADEKLTAFVELESAIQITSGKQGFRSPIMRMLRPACSTSIPRGNHVSGLDTYKSHMTTPVELKVSH